MQYEIKVIVRAVDMNDDSQDAIITVRSEWDSISDAVTDIAHHVDGTRPNPEMLLKYVLPNEPVVNRENDSESFSLRALTVEDFDQLIADGAPLDSAAYPPVNPGENFWDWRRRVLGT